MLNKKGISPIVSYVIIIAIVSTVAIGSYIWASNQMSQIEDYPLLIRMENQMISVENAVENVANGDVNFTTVIDLKYNKGIMKVNASENSIKYIGQLSASQYQGNVQRDADCSDSCPKDCIVSKDTETGIKMVKIPETRVFRGSTGFKTAQRFEAMACFNNTELTNSGACTGRSGPNAQLILRKTGYSESKPKVEVQIC